MKLYAFESCPFCVRVRGFIGLKNIDCEIVYLLAGSLPDHLSNKVDTFKVPMLEIAANDKEQTTVMQESSELIPYLDNLGKQPLFDRYSINTELEQWLESLKPSLAPLCYPRMRSLKLPELGSPEAMEYFEFSRKENLGFSLDEALDKTSALVAEAEEKLASPPAVLVAIQAYIENERPTTIDDLYAFAELRNLSMVEELQLPAELKCYIEKLSEQTKVPLYPAISARQ